MIKVGYSFQWSKTSLAYNFGIMSESLNDYNQIVRLSGLSANLGLFSNRGYSG